jgi:serine/threonine protein kinase
MSNLTGQSLGRYHILEQLGEGGMATVYKAYDTRLERNVAVKIILQGKQQSEQFIKRFEREAKTLASLSHPNIVSVIDYGEQDGLPYLVMEYIPGGTLKHKLNGQPMPWQAAARSLIPIARALGAAHAMKIIHRDVKPANILITQSGEPMLSDFGIAKILEQEETLALTSSGVGIGTPEYMAPEQGLGKGVDGRADIYALGITFYELVTGRKPYRADTPMAILHKQLSESLPAPSKFRPEIPALVENVLFKALAKDPKNRYQNMEEFAQALEKIAALQTKKRLPRRALAWSLTGFGILALIAVVVFLATTGAFKLPSINLAAWQKSSVTPTSVLTWDLPAYEESQKQRMVTLCAASKFCVTDGNQQPIKEFNIDLPGSLDDKPSWSPDGARIIFSAGKIGQSQTLYALDYASGAVIGLTNFPGFNVIQPAWSPDEKYIAVHSNCQGWLLHPDFKTVETFLATYDQCVLDLRWSPDSHWLAWLSPTRKDGSSNPMIGMLDVSTRKTYSIPVDFGDERDIAMSPDSKFLYLMVKEAGEMVSHQIPLACFWNGCTQQDFQKTSFNIPPQWRPNYFPQWGKQK